MNASGRTRYVLGVERVWIIWSEMPALVGLALVIVPTLAVLAIPGYLATRVVPALALTE